MQVEKCTKLIMSCSQVSRESAIGFTYFFTNVTSKLQGIMTIEHEAWNYKSERNLEAKIHPEGK